MATEDSMPTDGDGELSDSAMGEPAWLSRRTTCQLGDVDDEWDIDARDESEEIKEAIQAVREDHDEERIVEVDPVWVLSIYWNENTDSVWAAVYGYHGGFEVVDE